jgi:hypothetical protein
MSDTRFVTTQTAAPGRAAASERDVLLASSLLNTAQQVGGSHRPGRARRTGPPIRSM